MPTPIATAGRDTSERADTASQSVITTQSAGRMGPVSTANRPKGQAQLDPRPGHPRFLAMRGSSIYDRSSMIREALIPAAGVPARDAVASPRPFAIIAAKRR